MMKKMALALAIVGLVLIAYGGEEPVKPASGSSGASAPTPATEPQKPLLTPEQAKTLVIKAVDNLKKSKGYRFRKEIKGQVEGADEGGITAEGVYKDDTHFYVTVTEKDNVPTTFYRNGDKFIAVKNTDDFKVGKEFSNKEFKSIDVCNRALFESLEYNITNATCTDSASNKPPYIIEVILDKAGSQKVVAHWIDSYKEFTGGQGDINFSYPLKIQLNISPEDAIIRQIDYSNTITIELEHLKETAELKTTIQFSEHNQVTLRFPDKIKEVFAISDKAKDDEPFITYAVVAQGWLQRQYHASMQEVWEASIAALKHLQFTTDSSNKDNTNGQINAKMTDGTTVKVALEMTSQDITLLKVKVGVFGEREISEQIHEKIAANLKPPQPK